MAYSFMPDAMPGRAGNGGHRRIGTILSGLIHPACMFGCPLRCKDFL